MLFRARCSLDLEGAWEDTGMFGVLVLVTVGRAVAVAVWDFVGAGFEVRFDIWFEVLAVLNYRGECKRMKIWLLLARTCSFR